MIDKIIGRITTLKSDISKSPEYSPGATSKSMKISNEIISGLSNLQGNTMGGSTSGFGSNILNNMLGSGSGSMYAKNRMAIVSDINGIKRDISADRFVSPQSTQFINSKLDQIKSMK